MFLGERGVIERAARKGRETAGERRRQRGQRGREKVTRERHSDSPAGQLVAVYAQLDAPATEYAGDMQAVHDPAPARANVPAEQAVQRIAPAGEDVPAGQTPHT